MEFTLSSHVVVSKNVSAHTQYFIGSLQCIKEYQIIRNKRYISIMLLTISLCPRIYLYIYDRVTQ